MAALSEMRIACVIIENLHLGCGNWSKAEHADAKNEFYIHSNREKPVW